jgi:hypothetical protein
VAGLVCVGALAVTACSKDDNKTATTSSSSTSSTDATTTTSGSSSLPPATTTKAADDLTLTGDSYGPFKLGMTPDQAKATGLIAGDFAAGCELGGPGELVGTLKPPLDGTVTSRDGKLENIYARSHFVTSPGGIRVGDPLAKVQSAFSDPYVVNVDKTREEMFAAWFVDVSKANVQVFELWVDPATQKVVSAGVPYVPVCE